MNSLPERIMEYAKARPEATPIQADDLLRLGDRAAVARAPETCWPTGPDQENL